MTIPQLESATKASLWSRPVRRAYDASFGKIRRELANLRSDIHSLVERLDARQAAFNAELIARVNQLDKDVKIIAASRMELEAVTRRLATLEDHLIKDQPVELSGEPESPAERSS